MKVAGAKLDEIVQRFNSVEDVDVLYALKVRTTSLLPTH
jgi:hypothetical protein